MTANSNGSYLTDTEVDAILDHLGRSFMSPQFVRGVFFLTEHGYIPREDCPADAEVEEETHGWFWRLSASGYLDCTDWDGPHETERAAQIACAEQNEGYANEDEE